MKKRFVALLMVVLMLALAMGTALADETTKITIRVIKKIVGIKPEDLPEGTVFKFSFIDLDDNSLNGEPLGMVEFKKGDLMAATDGSSKDVPIRVPGGKPLVRVGVMETGVENLPGYRLDVKMECSTGITPGDKPDDPGDGSIPVGSFEFEIKEIDPDVNVPPVNRQSREVVPVYEITITNILTPIEMDLPQTGDESNLVLWVCAMLLSGTACTLLLHKKQEA